MDLVKERIEERINKHKACRIFSRDLDPLGAMSKTEKSAPDGRIEQIRQFAESYGYSALIYDQALRAVFRRK
jgi:hypothetical protein